MGSSSGPKRGVFLPNWEAGDDVGALVDSAVAAEAGGWDGVFLADHLIFPPPAEVGGDAGDVQLPLPDPFITLAAIAAGTDRVRLGTWITPVPRRQPWQVARDVATLDRLSGGRVVLGVGLGRRPDHERFGTPWDLPAIGRRCDEALDIIAALWSGQQTSYEGEHFTVNEATVLPTPTQRPRVPIVVGGLWPNTAFVHRGSRWDGIVPHFPGDGVLPGDGIPPEEHVQELVGRYREVADEPGEIMLLADPPGASEDYHDVCRRVGVTWLLTAKWDGQFLLDLDLLRQGPPGV